jgi:hypothetical protein
MVFKKKEIDNLRDIDSNPPNKPTLANCKTYYDEVILTLEVLEKEQGINLYNGSTFPGMHLKSSNNSLKFKKLFGEKEQKNQEKEQLVNNEDDNKDNDSNKIIPNNLLNFFKNGKKE